MTGRAAVLSWDWRGQPDLDALTRILRDLGGLHLHVVDTGADDYAIVLATVPLDKRTVDTAWQRSWDDGNDVFDIPDPEGDRAMTTTDPRREALKAALHPALHDLDVRINGLPVEAHHCNLVAEVALDALMPVFDELAAAGCWTQQSTPHATRPAGCRATRCQPAPRCAPPSPGPATR